MLQKKIFIAILRTVDSCLRHAVLGFILMRYEKAAYRLVRNNRR